MALPGAGGGEREAPNSLPPAEREPAPARQGIEQRAESTGLRDAPFRGLLSHRLAAFPARAPEGRIKAGGEMNLKETGGLLKGTLTRWSEDKVPRLAAALSFYALFSVA